MPPSTDIELLRRYANEKTEAAFSELVRGRINFVYGVALRQVGGDAHLAEEVTQSVFIALAHKAAALSKRPVLVSWLYTSTRLAAVQARRTRSRWINRQQEAYTMQIQNTGELSDANWRELRPVLDEAMHDLNEPDRLAVLLRYFDNRPLGEVGRELGLTENAARMRVDRAVEKLRGSLTRRGITSTAAALGAALAAQPVIAAPAGLAATVSGVSLTAIATGAGVGALPILMSTSKITVGAICAIAVLSTGAYVSTKQKLGAALAADQAVIDARTRDVESARQENARLKDEYRRLAATQAARASAPAGEAESRPATTGGAPEAAPKGNALSVFTDLVQSGAMPPSSLNRIPFLGKDRKLSKVFLDLFEATPDEKEALQRAVDDARQELGILGAANATVRREADGSVVVDVPPFTGGAGIESRLLQSFQQVLGPERNAAFKTLAAGQVKTMLAQYGIAQQTLTIRHSMDAAGNPSFNIQDKRTWNNEGGGHSNESDGYPVPDLATIEDSFGPLARLIPPGF